tara:strand:- start:356 stop:730 length:375 start_codon:yes stop_codon:yes gene_type:complete
MNELEENMSDKSATLKELLKNIDAKIAHIEDMTADHREVIVKLVKQNNEIVTFLRDLEITEISDEVEKFKLPDVDPKKDIDLDKFRSIKELVEEFMDKQKDLQELEKELKKHKEDITPGQIGEA